MDSKGTQEEEFEEEEEFVCPGGRVGIWYNDCCTALGTRVSVHARVIFETCQRICDRAGQDTTEPNIMKERRKGFFSLLRSGQGGLTSLRLKT